MHSARRGGHVSKLTLDAVAIHINCEDWIFGCIFAYNRGNERAINLDGEAVRVTQHGLKIVSISLCNCVGRLFRQFSLFDLILFFNFSLPRQHAAKHRACVRFVFFFSFAPSNLIRNVILFSGGRFARCECDCRTGRNGCDAQTVTTCAFALRRLPITFFAHNKHVLAMPFRHPLAEQRRWTEIEISIPTYR